jgi:hypothetical protein
MEQLIGSLAVIMGVLGADAAAKPVRKPSAALGFAVVAMVRMRFCPAPHPLRPLRCGVSPYALPRFFGKEISGAFVRSWRAIRA